MGSAALQDKFVLQFRWNREPRSRNAVCLTRGQFRPCCDTTLAASLFWASGVTENHYITW